MTKMLFCKGALLLSFHWGLYCTLLPINVFKGRQAQSLDKGCGLDLITTSLVVLHLIQSLTPVTPVGVKSYHMTAVLSYTLLHLLVIGINNHICFRTTEIQTQHALDQNTQMRVLGCTASFKVLFHVQLTKAFLCIFPIILLLIQ